MMVTAKRTFISILLALLSVGGALVALILSALANTPDFSKLRSRVTVPTIRSNGVKSTRSVGPAMRGWTSLAQISNAVITSIIASEDTTFFTHRGFDLHEIHEAIKKDLKEKRWARGASTITQQVIKNVYLSTEKNIWRKIREIVWAWELEKRLSKSEILCFYLNLVEWGPGIYGISEAAAHYFGLRPAEITYKQGAFLAMLLPSPRKYYEYFQKKELSSWARKRVSQILRSMLRLHLIEESEHEAAVGEPLWGMVEEGFDILEESDGLEFLEEDVDSYPE